MFTYSKLNLFALWAQCDFILFFVRGFSWKGTHTFWW